MGTRRTAQDRNFCHGGGRMQNTFYDFVGQSPLKVWEAADGDYGILVTVSLFCKLSVLFFAFWWNITRKSLYRMTSHSQYGSPSQYLQLSLSIKAVCISQYLALCLDLRLLTWDMISAGIKYELNATVCIKGKKCVIPYLGSQARYWMFF